MLLFAAEIDWVSLAEKGLTSAFFALAFGYALWRVGMKLLDSHFDLVKAANQKLDTAISVSKDTDTKLGEVVIELRKQTSLLSSQK